MTVTAETSATRRAREGKVILHVHVDPGIRRGIHTLASIEGVNAEDVLRRIVAREMRSQGLPLPEGLLEAS